MIVWFAQVEPAVVKPLNHLDVRREMYMHW